MRQFPIKAFVDNIIFDQNRGIHAFYRLPSLPYRFFDQQRKQMVVGILEEMLSGFAGHGQILLLWEEMNVDEGEYLNSCLRGAKQNEESIRHARSARAMLSQGARRLRRYLVLELKRSQGIANFKQLIEQFREIAMTVGTTAPALSVPSETIAAAREIEEGLAAKLKRYGIFRGDFLDLDFIIRRAVDRAGVLPIPLPERSAGRMTPGTIAAFTNGAKVQEKLDFLEIKDTKKTHTQSFLHFVDYPRQMPSGGRAVFNPDSLGFPFDVAMHFEVLPPHAAARKVDTKRRLLRAQMEEALAVGEETDYSEESGFLDGKALLAQIEAGKPLASLSVCVAVAGQDEAETRTRGQQIQERFLGLNFRVVAPFGKQLDSLYSFLPGAKSAAPLVECDPGYIASLGPHFATELGDPRGFLQGWSGQTPVFWSPGRPARELNKTNAVLVSGSLGGGKSVLAKQKAYFTVLAGGYVLAIDPKGEYFVFKRLFPGITRVYDLSPRGGEQINPFTLSPDPARAKSIAMDYLTLALNAQNNEPRRIAISQALEKVFNGPDSGLNLGGFSVALSQVAKESPHEMTRQEALQGTYLLTALSQTDIGRVVAGNGRMEIFSGAARMVVLSIKELPLPRPGSAPERWTESERQGQAIMFLLAAAAREMAFALPREAVKMQAIDEAWAVTSTSEGERLIMEMIRIGRSFNLIPTLITQNVMDMNSPSIVNNVSEVYCFRALDAEESGAALKVLGAATDAVPLETFAGLRPGQCLYRDAEGRIGWLYVDLHPRYLGEVFDTKPVLAERREDVAEKT